MKPMQVEQRDHMKLPAGICGLQDTVPGVLQGIFAGMVSDDLPNARPAAFLRKKVEYIHQEIFDRPIMYNFTELVTSHVIIQKSDTKHAYIEI